MVETKCHRRKLQKQTDEVDVGSLGIVHQRCFDPKCTRVVEAGSGTELVSYPINGFKEFAPNSEMASILDCIHED